MTLLPKRLHNYFGSVVETVLGRRPARRELTVLPGDVYIVSYLRSGSTWARFLLGNLIHDEPVTFENVNFKVPLIYDYPDRVLRHLPRVLKSHEYFDPRYPRLIHLVRDPRDVAVSLYFYDLKVRIIPDGYSINEFVDRFIAAKVVGYADRLGTWEEHTLSWLRMRQGQDSYRLVRYEDLLDDPASELGRLTSLLGVAAPPERIQRAVELSSASHMRSLEQQQSQRWTTTKNTRQDIPFVREAKTGTWRQHLSARAVEQIEKVWGATMRELGYELTNK